MQKALLLLSLFFILYPAAFSQITKDLIFRVAEPAPGTTEIGGMLYGFVTHRAKDESISSSDYISFYTHPSYVYYQRPSISDDGKVRTIVDGKDNVPEGYNIFTCGRKRKELIPPLEGDKFTEAGQYLALAARYTGEPDTILLVIDPRTPEKMLVNPYNFKSTCNGGTGSECLQTFRKIEGEGIYVLAQNLNATHDNGKTWFVDSAGLNNNSTYFINDVAMDTSLTHLYAGTASGLYKQDTTDDKWHIVENYPDNINRNINIVFIDRNNRLLIQDYYYSNFNKAYTCNISTDGGNTWQTDSAGLGLNGQTSVKSFADDAYGNLYAIVETSNSGTSDFFHVYKSSRGSSPWVLTDSSLLKQMGSYPFTIKDIGGDSILVLNTSIRGFYSTDAGATWVTAQQGIVLQKGAGFIKSATGRLFAGNLLGVSYIDPADSLWHKTYPLRSYLSNPSLYQDSLDNIYTLDQYFNPGADIYSVVKSSNNGATWLPDTAGLYNFKGYGLGSNFFVDEKGGQHFAANNILISKIAGGVWGIDTAGLGGSANIYALGTDGKGYLYATGRLNGVSVRRRKLTDNQWQPDTTAIPGTFPYFPKMASSNKNLFVFTNINTTGKLFKRNADNRWYSIPFPPNNTPLGLYNIYVAAVSQDTRGYIYAAFYVNYYSHYSPYGVYYTTDTGKTWVLAGLDSISQSSVYSPGVQSIVSYGDSTYVITEEDGVFLIKHGAALPVTLSSLKAYRFGKGIQVEWNGYNEINISGYDVEKSSDGRRFFKIGSVIMKEINALQDKYSLFDAAPFGGDNYYRVGAVSKNGTIQYSGVVKVNIADAGTGITIYPNPVQNKTINIQLNNIQAANYVLQVYNAQGQKLYTGSIKHAGGNAACIIVLPEAVKGIYWVKLTGTKQTYCKTVALQ